MHLEPSATILVTTSADVAPTPAATLDGNSLLGEAASLEKGLQAAAEAPDQVQLHTCTAGQHSNQSSRTFIKARLCVKSMHVNFDNVHGTLLAGPESPSAFCASMQCNCFKRGLQSLFAGYNIMLVLYHPTFH